MGITVEFNEYNQHLTDERYKNSTVYDLICLVIVVT